MATEKNNSFTITGVFINLFVDGIPVNVVTNLNVAIRRDIQPVYAMFGNPNPIAYAYNVRRIGGMIEFASIDGYGAMQLVEGQKTWLSLTEGLSVINTKDKNELVSEEDFKKQLDANNVSVGLGGSNFYNSMRSSTVMREALKSFIEKGSTDTAGGQQPGVLTWNKQDVVYLDQANNLTMQFNAMIENKGYMYTRTMFGVTFHTHNIAIGMQVGSVEEGHYYAYQITPWELSQDLNDTDDVASYKMPTTENPYTGSVSTAKDYTSITGTAANANP